MAEDTNIETPATEPVEAAETKAENTVESAETEAPNTENAPGSETTAEVQAADAEPNESAVELARMLMATAGRGPEQDSRQELTEAPSFKLPQDVIDAAVSEIGEPVRPLVKAIEDSVAKAIADRDAKIARLESQNNGAAAERERAAQVQVTAMLSGIDGAAYGGPKGQTPQQKYAAQHVTALAIRLQKTYADAGAFMPDDVALRTAHAAAFGVKKEAKAAKEEAIKKRAAQTVPAPGERGGARKTIPTTGRAAALEEIRAWKQGKH